jgi:hypothetical protein
MPAVFVQIHCPPHAANNTTLAPATSVNIAGFGIEFSSSIYELSPPVKTRRFWKVTLKIIGGEMRVIWLKMEK